MLVATVGATENLECQLCENLLHLMGSISSCLFPTQSVGGPLQCSLQSSKLWCAGEQAVVQACGTIHLTRGTITKRLWSWWGPLSPWRCASRGRRLMLSCQDSSPEWQMTLQQGCTSRSPLHSSHQRASWCPRGSQPHLERHCMLPWLLQWSRALHDCLSDKA